MCYGVPPAFQFCIYNGYMKLIREKWQYLLVGLLVIGNFLVWSAVGQGMQGGVLTVAFLDVDQGDSIFIEGPTGIQVLIDGGKGKRVLTQLGEVMPFYDHSLDVIIATHPDQDHIEGLIGVLERYNALVFIEPDLITDKPFQTSLRDLVKVNGVRELVAMAGQRIDLGGGARLEILYPDVDVSFMQADTNKASVVARLVYGSSSFLFTGDSPLAIEDYLVDKLGTGLDVDVLKVGHHGSRTSSSPSFVTATSPEYAIISAGKDNSYGHPHKEVVERMAEAGAQTVNTADTGCITFTSDGTVLSRAH